jgi:hypothetical protein
MPHTNVKTRWVNGDLVFYDASGNIILTTDGTNRKLTLPAGSQLDISAAGEVPITSRISAEDTFALTAAMSGMTYIGTKASATQIISLPPPTTAGLYFAFVCGSAAGEINIDPGAATYKITAPGITVATTKDLKNTAATNVLGDCVELVSDGTDTWWAISISGIWETT